MCLYLSMSNNLDIVFGAGILGIVGSSGTNPTAQNPRSPKAPKPPPIPQPWKTGAKHPKFPDRVNPKNPKFYSLNIHREYGQARGNGDGSSWTPAAGIRELIQNLIDGILQTKRVRQHELRVEEWHDGKLVSADASGIDLLSTHGKQTVVFYIYHRDDPPFRSKGPKRWPLGYVAWRPDPSGRDGIGDLELYNVGRLLPTAWTMGVTTKAGDPDAIGQWGDGAKIGTYVGDKHLRVFSCSTAQYCFIRYQCFAP